MPHILKIKQPSKAATKAHDSFYDSPAWRKLRAHKLKLNPLCEYCEKKDKHVWGKIADHLLPRLLWPELSLDLNNLRSCCDKCHQKKRWVERTYKVKEVLISKLKEYGFR
jgi:5-methylcytosine-specific restriction endonuclease McrA